MSTTELKMVEPEETVETEEVETEEKQELPTPFYHVGFTVVRTRDVTLIVDAVLNALSESEISFELREAGVGRTDEL